MQYRGRDLGEQESELTVALVRIEEKEQISDHGSKDYWLHVREDLVRKVIELHTTTDATAVAAADQVLGWAISGGLDSIAYQIPL
jgi:hypothetical protein